MCCHTINDQKPPSEYKYLLHGESRAPEDCLETREQLGEESVIIRDSRKAVFMHFVSYANYIQLYPHGGDFTTHEVIMSWMKQKPKFDIDGGNEQLFAEFKEIVECAFIETYDFEPEFCACDSSNDTKFSRHLIIVNAVFTNSREADHFTREIVKPLCSGELINIIDWNVNSTTQNFRTPGSTKEGRMKRVAKPYTYRDAMITVLFGTEQRLKEVAPTRTNHNNINVKNITPEILEIVRTGVDSSIFMLDERHTTGNKVVFRRLKPAHCDICQRTHSRVGIYVCIFEDCVRKFCYRNDTKRSMVLWQAEKIARIQNADTKVYFGDYLKYTGTVHNDLVEIKQHIRDTVAFIINGGNSFYVTKNEDGFKTMSVRAMKQNHPTKFALRSGNDISKVGLNEIIASVHGEIAYSRMDFIPYFDIANKNAKDGENTNGKVFNLFSGFENKYNRELEVNEELIAPIINHIKNIWCKGDEKLYTYMFNWFAHIVQHPAEKMGVAVVLKSLSHGAGKNIICEFFAKQVLGRKYMLIPNDVDMVLGKFNKSLENKLITICDEISNYGGAYKSNDKLKSMITQSELLVEPKGVDPYTVADYNNYMFLTNNDWAVRVEASDRRYFLLDLENSLADDADYFGPIISAVKNPLSGTHFFHWLARRDLAEWSCRKIPDTAFKRELKLNSVPNPIKFLLDIFRNEVDDIKFVDDCLTVYTDTLYAQFKSWCISEGIMENMTKDAFSKQLGKIVSVAPTRVRIGGVQKRGFIITRDEVKNGIANFLKTPVDELFE